MTKADQVNTAFRAAALQVVKKALKGEGIADVTVAASEAHDGSESWIVEIVLKPRQNLEVSAEQWSEVSRGLIDYLASEGDERFPYLSFKTTADLAA